MSFDDAENGLPAGLSQALSRLGENLAEWLPEAIETVAQDLADAAAAEAEPADARGLEDAADSLRLQSFLAVADVAQGLVSQAYHCIAIASQLLDQQQTLEKLRHPDPDNQLLVLGLAKATRGLVGARYPRLVKRIHERWPRLRGHDDLNPLGARAIASSVSLAFQLKGLPPGVRQQLRRRVLERLPPLLARAFEDVARSLFEDGESGSDEESLDGSSPEFVQPDPDTGVISGAENALAADAADALAEAASNEATQASREGSRSELQAAAGQARVGDTGPRYDEQARALFFANARENLTASQATAEQFEVLQSVASLFTQVSGELPLPPGLQPLGWRLQQTVLSLALARPGLLADPIASLAVLVRAFHLTARVPFDQSSRRAQHELRLDWMVRFLASIDAGLKLQRLRTLPEQERESANTTSAIASLIDRLQHAGRPIEPRSKDAAESDPNASEELVFRITVLLSERVAEHQAPESVRDFLLDVWSEHLKVTALREGEHSDAFRFALQVVDDLLWSFEPDAPQLPREAVEQRIPSLIRLLGRGVRDLGLREEELKPFFDELFLVHLRKMQQVSAEATRTAGEAADPSGSAVRRSRHRRASGRAIGGILNKGEPGAAAGAHASDAASAAETSRVVTGRRRDDPQPGTSAQGDDLSPSDAADTNQGPEAADDDEGLEALMLASSASAPKTSPTLKYVAPGVESGAKLLEVLASLDLGDLPAEPTDVPDTGGDPLARLSRGDWLRMQARDGSDSFAKVAWINERRTMVLMVRYPDRRAISMRTVELTDHFLRGRASLVEANFNTSTANPARR